MPDAYSPGDPMRAAQANMRPPGIKKFYAAAGLGEAPGGFALLLDGRPANTPGKRKLVATTRALGELVVAEWAGQGAFVLPEAMPVTRIVNSAIDGIAFAMQATRAEIALYAGSDMLCYRASEPETLALAQRAAFDPVLAWVEQALGARFAIAHGITHVAQPAGSVAKVRAALDDVDSPFALAALHVGASLTGSALLALAVSGHALSAAEAWRVAHVDEDFQMSAWGGDEDAQARRQARWREFEAAGKVLAALDSSAARMGESSLCGEAKSAGANRWSSPHAR